VFVGSLAPGVHTLALRGVDVAGNHSSALLLRSWTVIDARGEDSSQGGGLTSTGESQQAPPSEKISAVAVAALECVPSGITLTNVVARGGKASVSGAAAEKFIGMRLDVYGVFSKKRLGTATVNSDGLFAAKVSLPARRLRSTNRARYYVRVGKVKSSALKLSRRLLMDTPKLASGKVRLAGRAIGPLASPPSKVTVQMRLSCKSWKSLTSVRPRSKGSFSASFKLPAEASVAVFRARTAVRSSQRTQKASSTFSLPRFAAVP
jgi:hypothetical protein